MPDLFEILGWQKIGGATFSPCERYRYKLWRVWDEDLPTINFLCLNPSTATAETSDPTVTRCERRARKMGYGRLIVTNLFALRSTDPAGLRKVDDPVGPDNDAAILEAAEEAKMVVCAWGEHGSYRGRADHVIELLYPRRLHCLKQNQSGAPMHPLYVSYEVLPTLFGRL